MDLEGGVFTITITDLIYSTDKGYKTWLQSNAEHFLSRRAPAGTEVSLKSPGMAWQVLRREVSRDHIIQMSQNIPLQLLEYLWKLMTKVNSLLRVLNDIVHGNV